MAAICVNWSTSEDVQLCISFCRQSVDPISGSRQRVNKLWEKVHADYQQNWVRDETDFATVERTQSALQARMAKLKSVLVYWGSCLSYARRTLESGCNAQDEMRKAQVMFVGKFKKTFKHFECWEQVKNHQTFATVETNTPAPFSFEGNPMVDEVHVSDLNFDDEVPTFDTPESNPRSSSSPIRPPGVKAAKDARKKGKKIANKSQNEALLSIAESQRQHLEQNQQQMERDWKMQQLLYDQNQQKLDREWKMQQQQFNFKKREEETRIMLMDTDMMTPKSKKFFSKRKSEILQRVEDDEEYEASASANISNCYRPLNFDD